MTNNGLKEFPETRAALLKDAKLIISICNSESGHLGDVVSGIKTTMSSLDIKAKKLWQLFEDQKHLID